MARLDEVCRLRAAGWLNMKRFARPFAAFRFEWPVAALASEPGRHEHLPFEFVGPCGLSSAHTEMMR